MCRAVKNEIYFTELPEVDLQEGELAALTMTNPEGINGQGRLYTYPITFKTSLAEVDIPVLNIVIVRVPQGQYDGQTICTRLMIRAFSNYQFRVFGLLEEWIPQLLYWGSPAFSAEISLFKPYDTGEQVSGLILTFLESGEQGEWD